MKSLAIKLILICIPVYFAAMRASAQQEEEPVTIGDYKISVTKKPCMKYREGYYLDVKVRLGDSILDPNRDYYDYSAVWHLDDSIRIEIIEQLMAFLDDTSFCCKKVNGYINYTFGYGRFDTYPVTTSYSIGIEAMFIINRICYAGYIDRISEYHVLYDLKTQQEANSHPELVAIMADWYRKWFDGFRETGVIPREYNVLNHGRVRWWGMHGGEWKGD